MPPLGAERDRLLTAHQVAARFYRRQLDTEDGRAVARFLARRGAPVDGPWVVGYAPDRPAALVNELRRRGLTDTEIRASGLSAAGRAGALADRFRDRATQACLVARMLAV